MSSIDQQFIEYIVKSLVGKPDEVVIDRTIDEKGVLLELTVDPEDLGRVLVSMMLPLLQSLRTLLRALGTKNDARYNLKIVDNGVPRPEGARKPKRKRLMTQLLTVTTLQVQMTLRQLTFHKWKKKLMSQKRAIASRTPAKNLLTSTT